MILDISEEWNSYEKEYTQLKYKYELVSPQDHFDWKGFRGKGVEYICLNYKLYNYCKHGLLEEWSNDIDI